MGQYDRGGIGKTGHLEDFPRVDKRCVQSAHRHSVDADDLVLGVQEEHHEVLPVHISEVLVEHLRRSGGSVDLLPLGTLAAVADEPDLVDGDAVHACLLRMKGQSRIVPASSLRWIIVGAGVFACVAESASLPSYRKYAETNMPVAEFGSGYIWDPLLWTPVSISPSTKHLLWVKAAGRCAFPDCRASLIAESTDRDPSVPVGEMAHIVAQSEERGPRHEFEVPGGDRDGYKNLVLLCPVCHTKIDRQSKTYTVERLLQIKADHEAWVLERLNPEEARLRASSVRPHIPEQVHGTILWVEQMPRYIYTATCEMPEADSRRHIRAARPEDLLPYIVREKKLITFAPLDERQNPFSSVIDDAWVPERHLSSDWWQDADLSNWYVTLLNRLMNKVTGRKGLNFDKEHRRYYFEPLPADDEGGDPQPRDVSYRPLNKVISSKQVAWRPRRKKTGEAKNYWEHMAVGLRFTRISQDQWALSIRPERRFTRDGYVTLTPKGTGSRSTNRKSRMFNYDLLAELQFWRDYLTDGGQRIIVPLGGPSLIIDGTLLSTTVHWPGVPGDKKSFANAQVEDDLFTSAAYLAALDGDESAELDDWEAELEEELTEEQEFGEEDSE